MFTILKNLISKLLFVIISKNLFELKMSGGVAMKKKKVVIGSGIVATATAAVVGAATWISRWYGL